MHRIILISMVVLVHASCTKAQIADNQFSITDPTSSTLSINYLALGDSYTIGEGVAENDRWPVQLSAALNASGLIVKTPRIVARTGWTTDELMAELNRQQIADSFQLVSLLIGVNNQYRGRPAAQFQSDLVQLIERAVQFAGGRSERVFLVSIPDWGVTPFAAGRDRQRIAKEIDQFNDIIRAEALSRNMLFFDITPISRQAAQDQSLLASDLLHPSGSMYRLWVDLIHPEIQKLFIQP